MEGVFIALDGSDASITEAQFGLLANSLRESGYDVETFDFTRYDQPSGHFVREYQRGRYGSDADVGPYTGSLFYALDQYHAAPQIREAVKAGKVVLARHYTGSTMAEQGQKFVRPEERRGFFLWLESMETRMFGLPRPAASIVLRAPAGTAKMDYPSLLTEAYDDLCQLFSKDYWRLDIARSGKTLPEETIQSLILAKITPLLPPLSNNPQSNVDHPADQEPRESSDAVAANDITAGHYAIHHVSLDVSDLLASEITDGSEIRMTETTYNLDGTKPSYYIPENLDNPTRSAYQEHIDRIFELYYGMADKLAAREGVRSRQLLDAVLPVATIATLNFDATATEIAGMIEHLGTMPSAEAKGAMTQLAGSAPPDTVISETSNPGPAGAKQKVADLSAEYLASNYAAGDPRAVELTDIWPRNELDLVPHMLFTYSSLPLKDIRQYVSTWSYRQKADIVQVYLDAHLAGSQQTPDALHMVRYGWDLLCDYSTYRELQRADTADYITRQPLTPRYGFDVPDAVDEAGLLDDFEECFAISLRLHSILQQAGYNEQSQYATLRGHKLRMRVTINASQTYKLFGRQTSASQKLREISSQMFDTLSEYHPMIAALMPRIDEMTGPS